MILCPSKNMYSNKEITYWCLLLLQGHIETTSLFKVEQVQSYDYNYRSNYQVLFPISQNSGYVFHWSSQHTNKIVPWKVCLLLECFDTNSVKRDGKQCNVRDAQTEGLILSDLVIPVD